MENKKIVFAFAISLILIFSVGSVYAFSLGDFFKGLFGGGKLTGNAVADSSKIINIDFGTSSTSKTGAAAVGNAGDFWNSFAAVHTGPGSYYINNLKFANSQSSSISMAALEFYSSWGISYGGVNDPMFDNYIYSYQPPTKASKIVLANVPSGTYDFYVYGHEGDYGDQYELTSGGTSYGVKFTIYSHDVYTSSNWVDGLHYVVFEDVVVASTKNITLTVGNLASKKSYSGAIINGLQIVPAGTDKINQTVTPIDGVCAYGINVCTNGTISNSYENNSGYYWTCLGQNGGSNASCSYSKFGSPNNNVTLTIQKGTVYGIVNGIVRGNDYPYGIYCGSSNTCVFSVANNSIVNLTFTSDSEVSFGSWGYCDQVIGSSCIMNMFSNKFVQISTIPKIINQSGYLDSATRNLPDYYALGVPFKVSINITFLNVSTCGGAYVETIPSGFNASGITGTGAGFYNPSLSTITWAPIDGPLCGGADSIVLTYNATPSLGQSGVKTFSGQLSLDGYSVPVLGDQNISQVSSNSSCYDNDGGINYLLNGSTWGTMANGSNVILNDYCNLGPNGIYEGYCNSNNEPVWYANISACPNGCSNGACIQNQTPLPTCADFGYNTQNGNITVCDANSTQQYDLSVCRNMTYSCTDYDNGENYFFKSYASGGVSSRTGPSCSGESGRAGGGKGALSDTCLDSNIIREAVCSIDKRSNYTDYSCSSGCANGACINDTRSCDYGCFLNSKCVPVGYRKAPQYCDIDGIMKSQREKVGEEYAVCDNNYECESNVCSAGKCVEVNELINQASGFRVFVIKSLCRLGTLVGEDYNQCLVDNLGSENLPAFCMDSDGGINYYLRGNLTGFIGGSIVNLTDDCSTDDNVTLYEVYCNGSEVSDAPRYTCPNGCSNGACLPQNDTNQSVSCTDSDGGLNYYLKGTATGGHLGFPGEVLTASDQCELGNNYVDEIYCGENGNLAQNAELCPNGCLNGACLQQNSTNQTGFDYTLSVSNLAITQGSSASQTMTVTKVSGNSQAVTVSVGTLPTGVALASANSQSCTPTSGSCSVTFTYASLLSALVGANSIPITATSYGVSTKSSSFSLAINPAPYSLSVAKLGSGSGTVLSNPSGINCGSSCLSNFVSGTYVTLMVSPTNGSVFSGWTGSCSGSSSSCTVYINSSKSVVANFSSA